MAEPQPPLSVEVAYGTPEKQKVVELAWSPGLTAREAVEQSGLLAEFADINSTMLVLGINQTRVAEAHVLRAGDRVEICRPLAQDPRDMRRAALSSGGVMGQTKS
jgi:putative ubiquitin-RnfH superfamily antitoxin RatB of RatAB toxin-antitoxin module